MISHRTYAAALLAACAFAAPAALAQQQQPQQQNAPDNMARRADDLKTDDAEAMTAARAAGGMAVAGTKADVEGQKQLALLKQNPQMAADKLFAMDAAAGSLFEIELSRAVLEKATDPKVKDLAQTIIKEHTEANAKLLPIAEKMGLTLPAVLMAEKQAKVDVLRAMPPADAEKKYLSAQRALHAYDITAFSDYSKGGMQPDLKAFAAETLPHLKAHGQQIVQVSNAKGIQGGLVDMPAGAMTGGMSHGH